MSSPTQQLKELLGRYESRNVTFIDDDFPIFWESASDSTVIDAGGKRYTDLTSAFGVANAGHANPIVAAAIASQANELMHAMGDVHPAAVKTQLLEVLAEIAPGRLQKSYLASTGSEAVEAALKTAMLATGKRSFASFRNGYHGLSFGTLEIIGIPHLREPFARALPGNTLLLDFPNEHTEAALDIARAQLHARDDLAAVIVEPIQARGGCVVPARGYLPGLRAICGELGILLICDEIYTGFGRTGSMFAIEEETVVPDILCIGKAMAGGFPISAAIGTATVMDSWPLSSGEALHTSTHLGNPIGCAAALANIAEIRTRDLPARARALGGALETRLRDLVGGGKARAVRGQGLMWGVELADGAMAQKAVRNSLRAGVLILQAGPEGNVLSITPPLVIGQDQLMEAIDIVESVL